MDCDLALTDLPYWTRAKARQSYRTPLNQMALLDGPGILDSPSPHHEIRVTPQLVGARRRLRLSSTPECQAARRSIHQPQDALPNMCEKTQS